MEEVAVHTRMVLAYQMSPVTLKMNSGTHSLKTRRRVKDGPVHTNLLGNNKIRTTSSVNTEKDNENILISRLSLGFNTQAYKKLNWKYQ